MNTTQKELFAKMINTASQLPVKEMKRVLTEEVANPTLDTYVFDSILNALETKISEEEFITFCEAL